MWIAEDYLKSYEENLNIISKNFDTEALGIVISKFNELKLILSYLNKFPFQHDLRLKNLRDRVKKLDQRFIKMVSENSEGYLNAIEHDLIRLLNKYEACLKFLFKNDPEIYLQLLEIRDRIQYELMELKGKRDSSKLEKRLEEADGILRTNQEILRKYGDTALPFPMPEQFWWRKLG
ncbi:MAG: hypothetical protein QXJ68_05025 [Methanocellales archaeon]